MWGGSEMYVYRYIYPERGGVCELQEEATHARLHGRRRHVRADLSVARVDLEKGSRDVIALKYGVGDIHALQEVGQLKPSGASANDTDAWVGCTHRCRGQRDPEQQKQLQHHSFFTRLLLTKGKMNPSIFSILGSYHHARKRKNGVMTTLV